MSRQWSGWWSMTWIKACSTWRYRKHKTEKCADVSKVIHVMYGGAVSVSMRISKATTTPWVQLPENFRLPSSIFHLRCAVRTCNTLLISRLVDRASPPFLCLSQPKKNTDYFQWGSWRFPIRWFMKNRKRGMICGLREGLVMTCWLMIFT